jgi:hypothetical protein
MTFGTFSGDCRCIFGSLLILSPSSRYATSTLGQVDQPPAICVHVCGTGTCSPVRTQVSSSRMWQSLTTGNCHCSLPASQEPDFERCWPHWVARLEGIEKFLQGKGGMEFKSARFSFLACKISFPPQGSCLCSFDAVPRSQGRLTEKGCKRRRPLFLLPCNHLRA